MVHVRKLEVGIEEEVQLPTDDELVVAALAGEAAAFAALFTRYKTMADELRKMAVAQSQAAQSVENKEQRAGERPSQEAEK